MIVPSVTNEFLEAFFVKVSEEIEYSDVEWLKEIRKMRKQAQQNDFVF